MTYYVAMTDKFLSGWGLAKNGLSKLVIECDTYPEAKIVFQNAHDRSEMKNISLCLTKPHYPKNYHVHFSDKTDAARWFMVDAFVKSEESKA